MQSISQVKKMPLQKRLLLKKQLWGHTEDVAVIAGVSYNTACMTISRFIETGEWRNMNVLAAVNATLDRINTPSVEELVLSQKLEDS
jgi:hypothetical protein